MKMERACNLDVPTGATPMTIADAILRELDKETLEEVLYFIDCFLKRYNYKEGSESEWAKMFLQEVMLLRN